MNRPLPQSSAPLLNTETALITSINEGFDFDSSFSTGVQNTMINEEKIYLEKNRNEESVDLLEKTLLGQ